jgi:thiol-disulfide isomerase/thioredoxin
MRFLARHSTRLVFIVLAVACLTGWLASRASVVASEEKPGEKQAGQSDPNDKKEPQIKTSEIPADTFVVPANADAPQLLKKIHTILQLHPEFKDEADAEKFLKTSRNTVIEAADRVVKGRHSEEQEVEAKKAKLKAYQDLLIVGVKGVLPEALKFAESLKDDQRPTLSEIGNAAYIDFRMSTIPTSDPKERQSIVNLVATSLQRKPRDYFPFAEGLGMMLEQLGDGESAAIAYEKFGNILSKNLDENVRAAGEAFKNISYRRARLLCGDPVNIAGKTLDGKPFDINQYKGKVVVIDYWATWCGPCRAELKNLEAIYKRYHDRGFEIVGVSIDDSRDDLVNFLKENRLPWKIINSSVKKNEKEFEHPLADQYGIMGIPTLYVINREGKVISLSARGPELTALVDNLMTGHGGVNGSGQSLQ